MPTPTTVYHLITDLPTLASLAEENEAMEWRKGDEATSRRGVQGHEPQRLASLDARRAPSPTPNRAAFSPSTSATRCCRSRTGATTSSPPSGGCRVTERTWDRRPGWFSKTAWVGTGVRDRDAANAEHIKLTLGSG